jgi:hypothetical protein
VPAEPRGLRGIWRRISRRPPGESIPLANLPSFDGAARRAYRIRILLAVALVGAAIAAFVVAPAAPGRRFLPANTVGIVALDVSASIKPDTYYRIEHELAALAATRERFGLVLFSDVAYEALPPGTPASELRPLLRFFAPPTAADAKARDTTLGIPNSPWIQWFSAGTNISTGLFLAADMLRRDHVNHGAVVLISDLADDPTDLAPLANAVLLYQQNHTPLQIVALNPTPEDAEFFKNLLGAQALIQTAKLPSSAEAQGKLALVGEFPRTLAIVAVLAIVLLALNEWWAEPLRWRPRRTT